MNEDTTPRPGEGEDTQKAQAQTNDRSEQRGQPVAAATEAAPLKADAGSRAENGIESTTGSLSGYRLEHLTIEEGQVPSADHPGFKEELEMIQHSLPEPQIEAGDELIDSLAAIPDKVAFKIGEAAEMVGVKQYVLRYWETEFDVLRPKKSKNNQRVYSRRDVETAMMIKKLLYDDRFSIEGARAALKQLKTQIKEERGIRAMAQSQETAVSKLQNLVSEIRRIRDIFL